MRRRVITYLAVLSLVLGLVAAMAWAMSWWSPPQSWLYAPNYRPGGNGSGPVWQIDWSRGRILAEHWHWYPIGDRNARWITVQIESSDWWLLHRQYFTAQKAPAGEIQWPFRPNPKLPVLPHSLAWRLEVPYWLLCLPLLAFPIWVRYRRGSSRVSRRRFAGLCTRCGYDLRATPDRCPECGAFPTDNVPDPFAVGIKILLRLSALVLALLIVLVYETGALMTLWVGVPGVSLFWHVLLPCAVAAVLAWYAVRGTLRLRPRQRMCAASSLSPAP